MQAALEHAYRAFQVAYGRLCELAARAIHGGTGSEHVASAFVGLTEGDEAIVASLAGVRAARAHVNERVELVKYHARRAGLDRTAAREMVRLARMVRDAAESEWMVQIPTMSPAP